MTNNDSLRNRMDHPNEDIEWVRTETKRLIADGYTLPFITNEGVLELIDLNEELEEESARLKRNYPCNGKCNYAEGPDEECPSHGRPPADLWDRIAAQVNTIQRVRGLHAPDAVFTDTCSECSDYGTDEHPAGRMVEHPCPTIQALGLGDPA